MFRKILVAVDGSPQGNNALTAALDIAKRYEAMVSVINVVQPFTWTVPSSEVLLLEQSMGKFQAEILEKAVEHGKKQSVEIKAISATGYPPEIIAKTAKAGKYDLIVIGNRGLSKIDRFLLGSTSEKILRSAECTILVVKD
ncbi:universal stress protein [Candidatus Micrarchaeota archaeon]|nr:universal stress protein [Candidatus Micrarchaeota archaeon]